LGWGGEIFTLFQHKKYDFDTYKLHRIYVKKNGPNSPGFDFFLITKSPNFYNKFPVGSQNIKGLFLYFLKPFFIWSIAKFG
jgi:hypothetical protein